MRVNQKINLDLYKTIYLIRKSEQTIIENYSADEMKTPMHMSMGSEAIATGVCLALGKTNQVLGTYRSHALYLAKTQETDKFFAEMYGKATGVIKGKGGSMHLIDPESGLLGVSAIVASTIPLALGAAYVNKMRKNKKIVAVFFGDGAIDEGVFWESLNSACLFKLPVLFVCEDNGYAVHTPTHSRHGYKDIIQIVSQFNCQVLESDSTDPEEIYLLTQKALKTIQKKQIPVFLYLKYYRYLEHVGVLEDFNAGYRDKKDFQRWFKKDPISLQRNKLLKSGIDDKKLRLIEERIDQQIQKSLLKAQKDPFPNSEELHKHVYAD